MAIRLFLTAEGNVELNSLEQKGFSINKDAVDLLLPFKTIEKSEHHVVVDPSNKLGEVLEYILSELKKINLPYVLDHQLSKCWDNYVYENNKIKELIKKAGALPGKPISGFFKADRKPLPHQILGIKHMLNVENAANFSVPGSGKTQIALGAFVEWKKSGVVGKAIVIGPASCFEPWEDEAKDSLKQSIRIVRWSGTITNRRKISASIADVDLILITYQTACNDYILLEQIMRRHKVLLILDESHYIKNPDSLRSQIAIRLSPFAYRRIILTGTPAPHSLFDIWSQFSFLWPSQQLVGDFQSFCEKLASCKKPEIKIRDELSHFFIRTTKKDLGLPTIRKNVFAIKNKDIPHEQIKIIQLLELKTLYEARQLVSTDLDLSILRRWRSARIIRLLQAVSNPALLLSKSDYSGAGDVRDIDTSELIDCISVFSQGRKLSAKFQAVINLVDKLINSGRKVVIWSWFVENIKLLKILLRKYHPLMIYGEIKPYEYSEDLKEEGSRERNIHDFKMRNDRPILLANPAACAESISLHKYCQHAIYLDRNFNCGQFLQSMDRIHRVGMPPGLTAVYHIPFIDCAIERTVDKRLRNRQKILYDLLSDPMPVLGIDEEIKIADSAEELDVAFADLIKEIEHERE